jgi:hypothetical protein
MQKLKSTVSDVETKSLSIFSRNASQLSSLDLIQEISWQVRRAFFVSCAQGEDRGEHAHKECIQAIVCTIGHVEIYCFDGKDEKVFQLENLGELLIVPAGIWIKIRFQPGSSITVFASEKFAESDYIRDWDEYQKYRELK